VRAVKRDISWFDTYSFFGIALLISTHEGADNRMSAALLGINVTFLFESL